MKTETRRANGWFLVFAFCWSVAGRRRSRRGKNRLSIYPCVRVACDTAARRHRMPFFLLLHRIVASSYHTSTILRARADTQLHEFSTQIFFLIDAAIGDPTPLHDVVACHHCADGANRPGIHAIPKYNFESSSFCHSIPYGCCY